MELEIFDEARAISVWKYILQRLGTCEHAVSIALLQQQMQEM